MIQLRDVSYVRLGSPDLESAENFATACLGLRRNCAAGDTPDEEVCAISVVRPQLQLRRSRKLARAMKRDGKVGRPDGSREA